MREEKLVTAVQQLSAKMSAHEGSGDEAHTPVGRYQAGFMTPEMLNNLQAAQGERIYSGGGVDLFTLKPGHYYGLKYKNSPLPETDDSTVTVDITEVTANNGKVARQYLFIKSLTGEMFTFTQHFGGTNVSSSAIWTAIPRYAVLFTGAVSEVGTKITLTDSIFKYKRLIFELDTNNGGKYNISMSRYTSDNVFNVDFIKKQNDGTVGFRVYDLSMEIVGSTGTILSNSTLIHKDTGDITDDKSTAKINQILGATV